MFVESAWCAAWDARFEPWSRARRDSRSGLAHARHARSLREESTGTTFVGGARDARRSRSRVELDADAESVRALLGLQLPPEARAEVGANRPTEAEALGVSRIS